MPRAQRRASMRRVSALVRLLLLCATLLAASASPASAAISILNRGISPDPTVPNGTASITVDVAVDQPPYIVQFDCCEVISPQQTTFIDENQPETQGRTGRHSFTFNAGSGINATDRVITVTVFDSSGGKTTERFFFKQPVPPPPPAPAPDPDGATATGDCPTTVEFGLIQARQTGGGCWQTLVAGDNGYTDGNVRVRGGGVHYEGTGQFILNGIPFPRAPDGTKYVLAEPTRDAPGGQLGIDRSITVKLGPVTIVNGPLLLKLPTANESGEGRLAGFSIPDGALGGLPIGGEVQVLFRKRAGRFATTFPIQVTLPSIFRPSPGTTGSITGATEITTDDSGKVSLDGGKVQVANAAVGKLAVKDLCFSYLSANVSTVFAACQPPSLNGAPALDCGPPSQQQERFDGALLIQLPTASETQLAAYGGIAGGRFAYAGGFVDNAGIPLVQGVTLERVGFGLCTQPGLTIRGDAGLGFAKGIVRGDVSLTYSETGGGFFVEAAGFLTVAEQPFGNGKVRVSSSGAVDFEMNGVLPLAGGLILINGGVQGFVIPQPFAFNLDGKLTLCLNLGGLLPPTCAGASATISSIGAGGCLSAETLFGNIAFSAFSFYTKPAKGPQYDFGFGCKFQNRVRVKRASRLQEGGPLTFDVPRNNDRYVAHVTGATAPPKVRVTSPSGNVFTSGSGPVTTDGRSFLIVESAPDNETSVFLGKGMTPGDWKIEALPGSQLAELSTQAEDKDPDTAIAKVRDDGPTKVVELREAIGDGNTVSVQVVGEGFRQTIASDVQTKPCTGGAKAPGHTTEESDCASIRFTPDFGLQGQRTVQAVVTAPNGAVVNTIDVATFRAAAPPTPSKVPTLRLYRKGTDVIGTWGAAKGGTTRYGSYAIVGDGRKIGHTAPRNCFAWKIANVRKDVSVTLRVQAGRKDLKFGEKASLTLRGGQTYAGDPRGRTARIPRPCKSK